MYYVLWQPLSQSDSSAGKFSKPTQQIGCRCRCSPTHACTHAHTRPPLVWMYWMQRATCNEISRRGTTYVRRSCSGHSQWRRWRHTGTPRRCAGPACASPPPALGRTARSCRPAQSRSPRTRLQRWRLAARWSSWWSWQSRCRASRRTGSWPSPAPASGHPPGGAAERVPACTRWHLRRRSR